MNNGRKYALVSMGSVLARYVYKTKVIQFNKKLFTGKKLTDKGRCGVAAHEMWHSVTADRGIGAMETLRYMVIPFDLLRISAIFALVGILPAVLLMKVWLAQILFEYVLLALLVILVLRFLVISPYLKKRLWPIEYESDEAAARFIGGAAVEEFLKVLPAGSGPPTHPKTRDRLLRLKEIAVKYPVPIVDFDLLQAVCKQEFLLESQRSS